MTVSYHPFIPDVNQTCCICLGTLEEGAIAHEGSGDKHPLHRACAKIWLESHPTCPTCKADVDTSSLFTLFDHAFTYLGKSMNLLSNVKTISAISLGAIIVPTFMATTPYPCTIRKVSMAILGGLATGAGFLPILPEENVPSGAAGWATAGSAVILAILK